MEIHCGTRPLVGGFWERLIQSVKKCLKKTVGRTSLDYDELNTVLVETESIINSSPLTYIYGDGESISHPLTPSHLINGRKVSLLPNDEHFEIISTHNALSSSNKKTAPPQTALRTVRQTVETRVLVEFTREADNKVCKW